ncbi:hypothetical protein CHLNCDRAFT_138071 [Chlorella variabilis]|uniref:FAD-binding PCMH-type domain-containing protein n=1 Tax=Chlorella variabilis TaxID=554065 RepID=E1Z569_CHLVA|nr:hypothetical protein CHLNCDRAFT_138071 [Chlorella variabilis]EFN59179.1 hypothetical protein CHLNCDRAFT_138071 [Chlorella variabilis]|eukprot:XP_005851281.1 hypothetical protein CHLNCDRAFT_138071 [Chlorella variabilis]
MGRLLAAATTVLMLAGAALAQGTNYKCRQGFFECADVVKVGRPSTVEELQAMVAMFPQVKASGVGHSWWREQFCAGNDSRAVNIVTTEQQAVLDFMAAPVDPQQWVGKQVPAGFPIQVNELDEEVTVAAGITQRALLDYLSDYKYWKQRSGWTLPAFSWFLDQTIGGAVVTATHGSSMKYASLAAQLRRLKLVLANGTMLELSPKSNPHLFMAAGVSVGRLGIVTEVTLKIKPQQAVQRRLQARKMQLELGPSPWLSVGSVAGDKPPSASDACPPLPRYPLVQELSFQDFAAQVLETQEAYNAAKQANDVDGMRRALFQASLPASAASSAGWLAVDETQAFWALPTASVQRTDYEHLDHEPLAVLLNAFPASEPVAMSGPEDDVYAQVEKRAVAANSRMALNSRFWSNLYVTQLRNKVAAGTFESRKAFLSMAESETQVTSTFAPYDQYEVAVPISRAGSCLMEVGKEVYGDAKLWDGARTPFLVRFVTEEDFYLSPTTDGPAMYVNMEDYVSRSSGRPNDQFQRIMQLFRQRCGARLHWGKAGWPQHAKCFKGSIEYPSTWCSFGCAVQELDPQGKFASEWDGWKWSATLNGNPIPLASCCTSKGFSPSCQCAARTDC